MGGQGQIQLMGYDLMGSACQIVCEVEIQAGSPKDSLIWKGGYNLVWGAVQIV